MGAHDNAGRTRQRVHPECPRRSCPAVAGPAPYGYAFPPRPRPPRLGDEADIPCAVPFSPAYRAAMSGASSRSRPSLSSLMTVTDLQGACTACGGVRRAKGANAYGPTKALFDKAWRLPDVEKVK
jgi:hypothetical protein